uniref:Lectin, mannose-binding 2 n=1 Tax=Nannochloropsis gaditana (strain CCMP526) TaxID=1093141 RepID=I2CP59_NANGC
MVVVRGDARSGSRLLCLVWMCCLAMIGIVSGELMLSHSFSAPFNDVQVDGKRFVSRDWSPAGETQVNQNFVRLTPDRQSKIGALWSHKALGVDAVTMTLKFRIHGQGKKFFGDGIGFWVMESPYWQEGDLHGVSHAFVGVGVAFDTFRNTEHGTRHRDVAVFVNNGDRSREEVLTGFDGCDASIRYHGERADFSVTNSSRAKLTIEGNTLSVQIDPRGQGNWFQCTTVDLSTYNLPEHWLRKAHVGLTGTTGQLADNHDVISLHTFNDLDVHPEADDLIVTPKFGRGVDLSVEERLDRVEDMMSQILHLLDEMQAHNEHQLVAIQDHIANTIRKLQSQEDVSEARIVALEQELFKSVEGTVEERLKSVEGSISNAMAHRVAAIETNLHSKVNTVMAAAGSGGGGRWPVIVMCLLLALCMFQMYRWVERLKKSHIL